MGGGGGKAEGSGVRLQVSNSVYISPVEATADCSVIHAGRQAQNCTHTLALSLHALYVHDLPSHTHKHAKVRTKKAGGKAHQYTSPVLCLSHSLPHHHFVYDYTFKCRLY